MQKNEEVIKRVMEAANSVKNLINVWGRPVYDGYYTNSDKFQRWYKVHNDKEACALYLALGQCYDENHNIDEESLKAEKKLSYPEWICVTDDDDYIDDIDSFEPEEFVQFNVSSYTFCSLTESKKHLRKCAQP